MRCRLISLVVCLCVVRAVAVGGDVPAYTMARRQELKKLALATKYDCYMALVKLASDDPGEAAEGAKMMVHRIKIGRAGIAFFSLDIMLGYSLFKDRFTPEQGKVIDTWILEQIRPGSWHYRNRFCHLNDNWPFVTCFGMIIGGEAIGRDDLSLEATVRLEQYLDISREMGLGGEYNSPTYNPLSLTCVESIASLSKRLRTRVVARVIAERLWSEIATRYHAPSSQFAAPHSRAYMGDTLCAASALKYTLHPLLPGGVLIDRTSFPKSHPGVQSIAEEALLRHFLDPHLVAICEHKPFPYHVRARKFRPSRREDPDTWPGGFFDTVTYMTARYAVGSTQRTFCGGHGTTPFQVHWTRAAKATRPEHVGTLYTRYRANDELPSSKHGYLKESGYVHPLQHRNTTVILYRPKLKPNGTMKALCASVLVPKPGRLKAVYTGYPPKRIEQYPVSLKQPASVLIEDAGVYLAVHPLAADDRGRKEAMRIEIAGDDHLIVSSYNLQADTPQTWTPDRFLGTRNGFVIEVADAKDVGSFEAFVKAVGSPTVADTLDKGVRTVSYSRHGRTMVVRQRVATHAFLSREYDGQQFEGCLLATPHQVASTADTLKLGDATLHSAAGEPKWLTVEPTTGSYVVLHPFRWPFPVHLVTPKGQVRCKDFAMGRIVYQPGDVTRLTIDCAKPPRPFLFTKPKGQYTVIVNDQDVTRHVKDAGDGFLNAVPGAAK